MARPLDQHVPILEHFAERQTEAHEKGAVALESIARSLAIIAVQMSEDGRHDTGVFNAAWAHYLKEVRGG